MRVRVRKDLVMNEAEPRWGSRKQSLDRGMNRSLDRGQDGQGPEEGLDRD